jgi:hypothetical protein
LGCLVLSGGFLFWSEHWIQGERFAGNVKAVLSERTGGEADFQRIDLEWFPRPVLKLSGGKLSLPGSTRLTFASLTVFPEILAILLGEFRAAGWVIDGPVVDIAIDGQPAADKDPPAEAPWNRLAGMALAAWPDGYLKVTGGRLGLREAGTETHRFSDIHARVRCAPASGSRPGSGVKWTPPVIEVGERSPSKG